jgi:hypothetical protein
MTTPRKKDYVPTIRSDYNTWQLFIIAQILLYGPTWGIPALAITTLQATSVLFAPIYAAVLNDNTRTQQQVDAYLVFRKQFTKDLRKFVQAYLVNIPAISYDEKKAMGLNPRMGTRTSRPKILTMPVPSIVTLGGGLLRFEFRVLTEISRVSRHPDSDGVQVAYRFGPAMPLPPGLPTEGGVGSSGAQSIIIAGLSYDVYFSPKAFFVKNVGNQGLRLYMRCRWVNNAEPDKSGPWNEETSIIIS